MAYDWPKSVRMTLSSSSDACDILSLLTGATSFAGAPGGRTSPSRSLTLSVLGLPKLATTSSSVHLWTSAFRAKRMLDVVRSGCLRQKPMVRTRKHRTYLRERLLHGACVVPSSPLVWIRVVPDLLVTVGFPWFVQANPTFLAHSDQRRERLGTSEIHLDLFQRNDRQRSEWQCGKCQPF